MKTLSENSQKGKTSFVLLQTLNLQEKVRSAAMLIIMAMVGWALAGNASAYIIINAPMNDTNSAGWTLGGNPASALLTGNGAIDPVGNGWLRLTNNTGNQTGYAY